MSSTKTDLREAQAPEVLDHELVIREARRRQRRRWSVITAVLLVMLTGGLVVGLLSTSGSRVPNSAKRASTPRTLVGRLRLTSLKIPGPFVPQQIVSEGGQMWLLGSTDPQKYTNCAIEQLNPQTLVRSIFPIPQCAVDIAAGAGQLFLAYNTWVPGTAATRELRIEVFDTRTHRTKVLTPVDMTMIGSAIAHQTLAYGDGVLWLYGHNSLSSGSAEAVQISPITGAVLTSTNAVPAIGGVFPSVVANAGGLWLAGGPAGPPTIELIHPGSSVPTQIPVGPSAKTSVPWLTGVGNQVWADVQTVEGGSSPTAKLQLRAFSTSGRETISSPLEKSGYVFPLVSTSHSQLWTVSATCNGPQHLVKISGYTGISHVVTSLKSPVNPCLYGASGSQLASVNHSVFVLDPTDSVGNSVLFRVDVPRT